ncbi:MAG: lipid-A-disaccharide synthase [Bacteroidetes bacterium]|nr:lipid-A-disaccharide synthase [Bacteroidota bacterium]
MKYYIIAGEASGDLHGANLIKSIKSMDQQAVVQCWGGDLMQAAGGNVVKHYRDLAYMGFVEVVLNLSTILNNIRFCKKDIVAFAPDVLICIDYPGFNLRIAKWAKEHKIKVVYFIAPQVWAWKENRVPAMRASIDRLLCILPFEKKYFKDRWDWEVDYVGHPLMEVIDAQQNLPHPLPAIQGQNIIALLPGSRKQEIEKKLPLMLSVAIHFPAYQFVVAQAPGLNDEWFNALIAPQLNVHVVKASTYALLQHSKAALVTSGTATLETALLNVPQVVCYKGSAITYALAKKFVKIKFIALVNLIMEKEVVKELIQDNLNTESLVIALTDLLEDATTQNQIQSDYTTLRNKLMSGEKATDVAAEIIMETIQKK